MIDLRHSAGNQVVTRLLAGGANPGGKAHSSSSPPIVRRNGQKTLFKGKSKVDDVNDPKVIAALEVFATRADPQTIAAAANMFVKGTAEVKDKDLGKGFTGSGKASGALQAGGSASASAVELENAYAVLVEAKVVVGGSISLEGELKRKFGPVETALRGKLQAFAGAMASAKGHAGISWSDDRVPTGFDLSGDAKAFAGAKSKQSGEFEFGREALSASAFGEAEEMAGAVVEASGVIALSKNDIALGGEASAFAGAKVTGKTGGKIKIFGRDALKAAVSGTASTGAGGEAKGQFRLRRGVLTIVLEGHGALGVGAGAGLDTALDVKPIAVWVYRQIDKQSWKSKKLEADKILDSPDLVKDDLQNQLEAYGRAKYDAIRADKADNYVKIEKVQQIVGHVLPRKQVKNHQNKAAIDNMIKNAIEKAFDPFNKHQVRATVNGGKVEKIDGLPEAAEIKATSGARSMALDQQGIRQGLDDIIDYDEDVSTPGWKLSGSE